ncbi:hypothetical protein SGA02_20110 [Staphylococcus gallinarum]|uniref:Uncharacterized protein n=1 Tax=Staphylococcus gallinarum TaxID=1293 RepID=A0A380FA34_STAGA|nr:hypothetical protein SGA02_20110 [Staphylococcus gallinarum]SUM30795.1 Uncharacterised protein [Staphylococcus gallinarum]
MNQEYEIIVNKKLVNEFVETHLLAIFIALFLSSLLILYDFWIFLSLFVRQVGHGHLRVQTCR